MQMHEPAHVIGLINARKTSDCWANQIETALKSFLNTGELPTPQLERKQQELSSGVRLEPLAANQVQSVCGVDVHYSTDGRAWAAAVVLDADQLTEVASSKMQGSAGRAYEHGLLAFRELPLILEALGGLEMPPDLIFYDGNGILHARRFGAAGHLGVLLDCPVIGVSKNVASYRPFNQLKRGDVQEIEGGTGALVTTRSETKPVCVSPGHRIDLPSSIALTLAVSHTRIPEPIRRADQLCRAM